MGKSGEEHGDAALVGALGGVTQDGPDDDVADVGHVESGSIDGGFEEGGDEVVGGCVLQAALLGAGDRGAQRGDHDDVIRGFPLCRVVLVRWGWIVSVYGAC